MSALLEVVGLVKEFRPRKGLLPGRARETLRAVDDVDISLQSGETLAIVGESGSGKSTMARCIARLIEPTAGAILFDGRDISRLRPRQMRPLRAQISFVFQDPFASLDPRQRVGAAIGEPLRLAHVSGPEVHKRVRELMSLVGLEPDRADHYPHEFSGGQRQRVGIARAIAARPRLVICDEPVSALDVSIQAQILNLLKDLQSELGLAYVFISHDLSVVRYVADRVAVMRHGRIVEQAPRDMLFEHPADAYTRSLLAAVPRPDPALRQPLGPLRSGPAP